MIIILVLGFVAATFAAALATAAKAPPISYLQPSRETGPPGVLGQRYRKASRLHNYARVYSQACHTLVKDLANQGSENLDMV